MSMSSLAIGRWRGGLPPPRRWRNCAIRGLRPRVAGEVHGPTAVSLLPVFQTIQVSGDCGLVDKAADRASGLGREVEEMERLAYGTSFDRDRTISRHVRAETLEAFVGLRMVVSGRVEELKGE